MDGNKKRSRSSSPLNDRKTRKKQNIVLRVKLYNKKERGNLENLMKIRINPAKKLKTLFKLINDRIATNKLELLQLTVDRADYAIAPLSNMSIESYGIINKSLLVGTVRENIKKRYDFDDALNSSGSVNSSDYEFSDWENFYQKINIIKTKI